MDLNNSALHLIKKIVDNHPQALIAIYNQYGIRKMPSVETTVDGYHVYGEPFLMKVYDIYHQQSQFLGNLFKPSAEKRGEARAAGVNENQREKGKGWDKFKDAFKKGVGILGGVNAGANMINNQIDNPNKTTNPDTPPNPDADKKIMGMAPTTFYLVVFGAIALIAIMFFVIKKK